LFLGARKKQAERRQQAALLLISPEIIIVVAFYSLGLFVHVRASIVQKAISRVRSDTIHPKKTTKHQSSAHKYRAMRVSARALARSVLKL
jgi:hypothetical protein